MVRPTHADWLCFVSERCELSSGASTDDGNRRELDQDKGGAPLRRRTVARGTCPFCFPMSRCRTVVDRRRRVANAVESIFAYHFIYRRSCYSSATSSLCVVQCFAGECGLVGRRLIVLQHRLARFAIKIDDVCSKVASCLRREERRRGQAQSEASTGGPRTTRKKAATATEGGQT